MSKNKEDQLLRSDFPIILGGVQLPFPSSWEETSNTIETTGMSESGSEFSIVTRREKKIINCSFTVTSEVAAQLKELFFAKTESGAYITSLQAFDIRTGQIQEGGQVVNSDYYGIIVRIKNFSAKLKRKSENLKGFEGIWEISMSIEEQ